MDPQTSTERIGLWTINVNEILLDHYKLFTTQYNVPVSQESVWHFYDEHPDIVITMDSPIPNDVGVPYFYSWCPLPDAKVAARQVIQDLCGKNSNRDAYSMSRPHHVMYTHKNLKHMAYIDFYTSVQNEQLKQLQQQNQQHQQLMQIDSPQQQHQLQQPNNGSVFAPPAQISKYITPIVTILDERKYGLFDCPLWLPNGWLVYVISKQRQDSETQKLVEDHFIVFDDVNRGNVRVKEIKVNSASVAIAASCDGRYFAYSTFSPLGLCTGITIVNLQTSKVYSISGVVKLFYFNRSSDHLVYLASFLSSSQWCAWNEKQGQFNLGTIDPNTYTDRGTFIYKNSCFF